MTRLLCLLLAAFVVPLARPTPVTLAPVTARHGMVVAGHPQAANIGVAVLKGGGNAIDAAVATSLALGVAEPYASGLGGKLMLLYYEAKSGKTFAIDAMDAAGSLNVAAYLRRPDTDRSYGYGAVCVPGLAAGLWAAHQKWGEKKWADDVQPAIELARAGARILPKTREFFEEQDKKLRRGDAEIARLFLVDGKLPETGSLLANVDLARTLELLAAQGREGFYRGVVAENIVGAATQGGGVLTLADLERYEARVVEPIAMDFRGYRLFCAPPPAQGPPLFLTIMKALETADLGGGPLRSVNNLDRIGRLWRVVEPRIWREFGDSPQARLNFENLVAPASILAIRQAALGVQPKRSTAALFFADEPLALASTTHFVIVDAAGNVVCATQSLSSHFGAGVVAPRTGVVLNNSMSDFAHDPRDEFNQIAPGRRPISTLSPTIVLRNGRPVLALGVPGGLQIPTTMLQVLLDRLALDRPLADAIGDSRVHFNSPFGTRPTETFEAEKSLSSELAAAMTSRGWQVELREEPGWGHRFGGVTAIELNPDGTLTGFADPRRSNAAAGW